MSEALRKLKQKMVQVQVVETLSISPQKTVSKEDLRRSAREAKNTFSSEELAKARNDFLQQRALS